MLRVVCVMYGCETWRVSKSMKEWRDSAEMWFLRGTFKIL